MADPMPSDTPLAAMSDESIRFRLRLMNDGAHRYTEDGNEMHRRAQQCEREAYRLTTELSRRERRSATSTTDEGASHDA